MASEVKLPELGENLSGGDVVDVKVADGDTVTKGQTLLEVEAEKSTVEVPSPLAGRVQRVLVRKGETIQVGQSLFVIDEAGDGKSEPKAGAEKAKPASAGKKESTSKEDAKRPIASDPTDQRAAKPETAAPEGNGRKQEVKPTRPPVSESSSESAPTSGDTVPAGPATRRLARELGVELARVSGSGPGGRITPDDVKAFVRDLATRPPGQPGGVAAPQLPDFTRWGAIERQSLDGVRRKTAEQMALAWSTIPHVTQHDLADVTDLEAFRKSRGDQAPKLTVTAFALKAAAIALRQFPQFNSSLDTGANQLILKKYVHIGVAVDTERGLLVPVIRDADKKSVHQLAVELTEAAERARQKKLSLDDMRGGTFTITNLGGIGGTGFTPIVNYPEVAILGLSRGRQTPVVHSGQVIPRLLLPLSLSYDHRVIDGAAAARFARRIAEMLENPLEMLLHA